MATISPDRIAVSTWSLHRLLGTVYPHDLTTPEVGPETPTYGEGEESLLGLPSVLANHGYRRLEIVSFGGDMARDRAIAGNGDHHRLGAVSGGE